MTSSVVHPSSISDTSKTGNWLVCGREMPLLTNGTVRIHGPVTNRCCCLRKRPASFTNGKVAWNEASSLPNDVDNVNDQFLPLHLSSNPSDKDSQNISSVDPGPMVGKMLKRITWSSRTQVAKKLLSIFNNIADHNDNAFSFFQGDVYSFHCEVERREISPLWSTAVEREANIQYWPTPRVKPNLDQYHWLAARISSKLKDEDFRGAVRLACFESTFCTPDEKSLNKLQEKHPPPNPDTDLPPFHSPKTLPQFDPKDITVAVSSFPLVLPMVLMA